MSEDQHQRNLLRYATVGMEFFLTFMIFLAAGFALDYWVLGQVFSGFSILGAIIGFATGFYRITRRAGAS